MKHRVSVLTVLLAVLVAFALLVPGAAMAVGTQAGTTVTNNSAVDYKVGGVSQTQIISNTVSFLVDAKVNFTVQSLGGAWNTVTPGAAGNTRYLIFEVTNTGNTGLDFGFGLANVGGDDFDQAIANIVVDSNGNGTYELGADTALFVDELVVGLANTIFVVAATINSPQPDGDISKFQLSVTAFYNGTVGGVVGGGAGEVVADVDGDNNTGPNGVDWELADDGNTGDGIESATDEFIVSSASLTVTKTSRLLWDPINTAVNPIAIPGARISFTIEVANSGGAKATEVTLTDQMPAQMTYNATSITVINSLGPTTYTLTNAAGGCPEAGQGNLCGWLTGGDTVIVNGIVLDTGESSKVVFKGFIQ